MKPAQCLIAIIEREDDGYVALCPALDIASEGASIEQARTNLIEALALYFETAAPSEAARRFHDEVFVTQVEVPVGQVMMPDRLRVALIIGLAVVAVGVLFLLPPIPQDLRYHEFAGQRTVWGVPNFWNVVCNLGFLLVALWGLRALRSPAAFLERWERAAYCILLAGLALVAAGSTCYQLRPDNGTLVWDCLPMAVVFMSLLAATIGERISADAGRLLLLPFVALDVASVVCRRFANHLRF